VLEKPGLMQQLSKIFYVINDKSKAL
jgi:hypothetical protein